MSSQFDQIEHLDDGTLLQHGKFNDRIYLMKRGSEAPEETALKLKKMAGLKGYSKIFAKITAYDLPAFIDNGFILEGFVKKYFKGESDLFMVCCYLTTERRTEKDWEDYDRVLDQAKSKAGTKSKKGLMKQAFIRPCTLDDISQMTSIYEEVFPSYPFPIHDPVYLQKTMEEDVDYYAIEENGRILALSSAEIDYKAESAEMTDFATLPTHRGSGYASLLLSVMEEETAKKGIKTFYTIARAISPAMNITFTRGKYLYGGRLKNNTNISGTIESMNIWYKNL